MNTHRFESQYNPLEVVGDDEVSRELRISMEYFEWLSKQERKLK
jgi:hypothetical protein